MEAEKLPEAVRRTHLSLPRLRWARRFRHHELLRSSMWVLPSGYVAAALVSGVLAPRIDRWLAVSSSLLPEPDNARVILSAIGTGMITLTGFVFSFLLLLVQFGSTAFTPRLNRMLRRDWVVKHALGAFTATFMFSLTALAAVGHVAPGTVPVVTILLVGALLLLSLGLFFAMISRVVDSLRVSRVIRLLAREGCRIVDAVYHRPFDAVVPTAEVPGGIPVQEVRHHGPSAVLVALDRMGLVSVARHAGVTIRHMPAVGDVVVSGAEVFRVYGDEPLPEGGLRAALVLGDERTLEDDPAFALRLLVDIAIRALSPAVNDPTTAVQALDAIGEVLVHAASRDLDAGVIGDADRVWLVGPMPTWPDLLRLGTTEIRIYGRESVQVVRRLRALLEHLLVVTPEPRHAAVSEGLALLDAAVEAAFDHPDDRFVASQPDLQGLGPTRPVPGPRGPAGVS